MSRIIDRAPNGWVLFEDMPLQKPVGTEEPQPVIFDYSSGSGVFVANFGWTPGALDNAKAVMSAVRAHYARIGGGETGTPSHLTQNAVYLSPTDLQD